MRDHLIYPFYELKECIENFYYDCTLSIANDVVGDILNSNLKYCEVPQKKYVSLRNLNYPNNFFLKETLHYYEQHSTEFKIFATGMSYTSYGLNFYQFKNEMINFGFASQDLYYDYN